MQKYVADDVKSGKAKINSNLTWDSSLLRRSGTVGLTSSSLLGVDGCSCSATAFTLQLHTTLNVNQFCSLKLNRI